MLKGVQDANVCLWNIRENFTMVCKSNLIFHLNPCTSDMCHMDISTQHLSCHSHWWCFMRWVWQQFLSLQHHDCLVTMQVCVPPGKGVELAGLPQCVQHLCWWSSVKSTGVLIHGVDFCVSGFPDLAPCAVTRGLGKRWHDQTYSLQQQQPSKLHDVSVFFTESRNFLSWKGRAGITESNSWANEPYRDQTHKPWHY